MRIVSVSISDTFGTKNATFKPKSVTRFKGPNGSGKSSLIRALMKCFEGGSDPSAIRRGAEKSVVEFVTDDGSTFTRTTAPIKRRRGEDATLPVRYKTDLEILQPDGTPRPAPKEYLDSLSKITAVDPGRILRIDTTTAPGRKELADLLLSIVPIQFTPEEIATKLSADYREGSEVAKLNIADLALPSIATTLDLDGLKKYAAAVTEQRRRIGTQRDDADGAVNSARKSLPEDDGTDYAMALTQAQEYERDILASISERKLEIAKVKGEALSMITQRVESAKAEIDRDIDAKIKVLELERSTRKAEAKQTESAEREEILRAEATALSNMNEEAEPLLKQATTDIATYKARVEEQLRSKFTREQIDVNLKKFQVADRKYLQLSEVLARLDQMRKDKLDALPVQGLEVSGDQVLVDDIPWQNVNTARKIEVSVQLCSLLAGELGLIFLDDAEHLSTETRTGLEQGLTAAGFQLFEAIVSDADHLTIETVDVAA